MVDPVQTADGHTFERGAIERWFQTRVTSPLTNQQLGTRALVPNYNLRRLIQDFLEERPELQRRDQVRLP